ncbi:RNA polymerase sigma-70 factor (ECF subfamily) [Natranaerovirga pectinivora]|uniref:RNA polymerase sigma-70 factor (ECF subfamily) n=1 Tax=Natranaerovirga pectinivora TaxID=682400 RepID=A0A4R3MKC1_9FIRM|nr:RNA polymerase sigma factor [Natranaerovirga pectinivora]TCT14271.1 RNA polymerase sigma-70 factor (ECF subfamily) [Natranaerovirga pectinivora]
MTMIFLLTIEDEIVRSKLEEIYYMYSKDIYRCAFKILKTHHSAEDIVQNTIMKLIDNLENIEDVNSKKTKSYILTIATNMAINMIKKNKKIVNLEKNHEERLVDDTDLEKYMLNLETCSEIAATLSKINPNYADILMLKYFHEYSNAEIAEILQINENNVHIRLHRSKRELLKQFEEGFK